MRFIIYWHKTKPVSQFITFASCDNVDRLKELDDEHTQIVDTLTGEIVSPFGVRSKEYGQKRRELLKRRKPRA